MNTPATSNTGFDRSVFEKDLTRFGKDDGKGKGARVSAFVRGVEAASRLNDVTPDDAKELWTLYAKAAAASQGQEYSAGSSFTVQVSKFKQSLTLGALPNIDTMDLVYRALDVLKNEQGREDSGVTGSTYDNLVAVARAQIADPANALTDDQIRGVVVKADKTKSDLDKLVDLYKRTHKQHADLPPTSPARAYVAGALNALEDAITALDGELPPVTATDKAKAAVLAKAKKLGIKIVEDTSSSAPAPIAALIRDGEVVGPA